MENDKIDNVAISRKIPFPADVVYNAWVSSRTVIPPATAMEIVPETGGIYRLIMEMEGSRTTAEGTFSRVEAGKRLTYSWQWSGADEITEIDVRFASIPTGTEIRLTHSGFDTQTSRDNHDRGWDSYFDGLIQFLSEENQTDHKLT